MSNKLMNRELSWLSFNYRVLQEAKDQSVPLLERLKFLAIYSSNLDEFFRVRVAMLRKAFNDKKDLDIGKTLNSVLDIVNRQQEEFGHIYREEILPELEKNGIQIVNESQLSKIEKSQLEAYFNEKVKLHIQPVLLLKEKIDHFLKNNVEYLAVSLLNPEDNIHHYAIIEVPAKQLGRFHTVSENENEQKVIFLDDLIRLNLKKLFHGFQLDAVHAIKMTRDSDLYIEDEFHGSLLKKIEKSLYRRHTGDSSRFLYDKAAPKRMIKYLRKCFKLEKEDMVEGARYHNFSDFFSFPDFQRSDLLYKKQPGLEYQPFEQEDSIISAMSQRDHCLVYPYHRYDDLIRFLNESATDQATTEIYITLYRVADNSKVVEALVKAAKNGKNVHSFVEIKARFDEESNIIAAEKLKSAGAHVYYSLPNLKVHSKICMIARNENNRKRFYLYLATGNFNEKTSKIYSDFGLFTKHQFFAADILKIFSYLRGEISEIEESNLLIAPFNLREKLYEKIDREIEHASSGLAAEIFIKLNNVEDNKIIEKLYQASRAGVKIRMIVRGISCLIPGKKGLSENIEMISIVDRYLEHARVISFHNNGKPDLYLGSADFMKRNLSRRIEVLFPIEDLQIKKDILQYMDIQWNDSYKSRMIDPENKNNYRKKRDKKSRSQYKYYDLLKNGGI